MITIITVYDVYRFVDKIRAESKERGAEQLAIDLDDALHLGSSALELLGAIRQIVMVNRQTIVQLLGHPASNEVDEVIAFVDRGWGR